MSSYHILNAVIMGLFPMLIVSVIIGLICYLLCCISQLKAKFEEYRKKRDFRRARKSLLMKHNESLANQNKIETSTSNQNNEDIIKTQIKMYHYESEFNPLMSTPKNDEKCEKLVHFSEEINNIKETSPPSRSSLKLNLVSSYPSSNTYSIRKPIIVDKSVNNLNQHDSFVILELNESPKSTFTRMQQLMQYRKETENHVGQTIAAENTTNNLPQMISQTTLKKESTKTESNENGDESEDYIDSQIEDSERKSSDSFSSNEDKIKRDEKKTKHNNRSASQSSISLNQQTSKLKKVRKKLHSINSRAQSLLTNKNNNKLISTNERDLAKKPKLVSLGNKNNRLESDIEIMEDDILFHDEDDSFSSTGVCEVAGISPHKRLSPSKESSSQIIMSNSNCNFKQSTPTSQSNILNLSNSSGHLDGSKANKSIGKQSLRSNLINTSSISDIDPDDNILKNLLIKNNLKK